MLDEKSFVWNQYAKIHDLDCESNPINYFHYSNGVHFLCIKKSKKSYLVCGFNTPFHVKFRQSNFDVYESCETLLEATKLFERFITLLLLPAKFENYNLEHYQRDLEF